VILTATIAFSALVIAGAMPHDGTATQGKDLSRVSWLSGCWELRAGARRVEEQWMVPRGSVMLGMSRTARNDSIVEFEQVRIESRPGGVYYVASPSRQATAEFKASAIADSAITFENPDHDFPKKIIYRRHGPDSLIASVEGPRGGQTRTIAFPYRRVSCP
jgi:hypothetical protein